MSVFKHSQGVLNKQCCSVLM